MEVIIQRAEIVLRTVDRPVRHRRPAESRTILEPVLLLAVKRHAVRKLLVIDPGDSRRRCITFFNERFRNLRFYKYCVLILLAFGAAIGLAVVFSDFTGRRDIFDLPADILLADQFHMCTADGTDLFFFRKRNDNLVDLDAFESVGIGSFFLPGMFFDHCFLLEPGHILFLLGFIEKVQLTGDIETAFFAGRAKKLFGEIIDLFLQHPLVFGFLFNRFLKGTDQLRLLRHHLIQL